MKSGANFRPGMAAISRFLAHGLLALAALFAGAPALAQSAAITASSPATLNQSNLRAATLTVTLASATYATDAAASHFTLTTAISGLTVDGVGFNTGRTAATLRLRWDGTDFNSAATIAVTVAAAGTTHTAALTTGTVAVGMARWVNVSTKNVALTEGGTGTYTVTLESPPTGTVTVTVTSDHTAAVTRSPGTLTFSATTWNTPQTVTLTAVADDTDTVDEVALVTNVATGGGYASSTAANRTVRATVQDDDTRTGTDYDTDDDGLIEISGHAQLNAIRWDLDGNGSSLNSGYSATTTSAFPNPAAGMGCPDDNDANETGNCTGYELTADIDLDTDGDGSADSQDAYWNGGDGWSAIGVKQKKSDTPFTATFRGNGYSVSNLYMKDRTTTDDGQGLFSIVRYARIESVAVVDVDVGDGTNNNSPVANFGPLVGLLESSTVAGAYTRGTVNLWNDNITAYAGGLVGMCAGSTIHTSYADVSLSEAYVQGGLAGFASASSVTLTPSLNPAHYYGFGCRVHNSYAVGAVGTQTARSAPTSSGGLFALAPSTTINSAYWDRQTTTKTTSAGSPNSGGLTTAELKSPTAATGIYAQWDNYDVNGDGRIDAEDDAWHFGQANQYPALKWGGHAAATQFTARLSGQTDTAPSYAGIAVANKTYALGTAIQPFQIPPPTGGNGTYDYTVTGLLAGLSFDADGTGDCMAVRTVCGTPTATAPTTATVTVTVADADTNVMTSDRATLTFRMALRRPRVLATPARLAINEGGSGTYAVRLEQAPSANVTVAVSSDNATVTAGTSSLTFTTQNWNTAQSVTLTAAGDADAVDEAATITNAASNGGYDGASASVRVVVDDDEATGTDYDADNDGLIEIDSLAKLNALRWDLDGDGAASSGNETSYAAAFAGAATGEHMGCPDSDADADGDCAGYELTADLDFDTNGDGTVDSSDAYPNWAPIGGDYNATFHGNNRTISNLTTTGGGERGLFWGLGGSSRVSNLGLVDVSVTATSGPGANYRGVGALAGQSDGTIEAVYVRGGTVSASSGGGRGVVVGGLVGYLFEGVIRACYSTAAVSASSVLSPDVGGLAGHASAPIVASYAAGTVHVHVRSGTGNVGGLVGWATTNYSVFTNSYARGRISWAGAARRGGLLARRNQSGSAPGSTWDWQTTGQGGGGQTTSALQAPTGYTGIYAAWDDHDTNGDGVVDAADDAWDFGNGYHYPVLKYGGMDTASQYNDYDADDDGLVDITTLAQLNAVRWDLDGDGAPAAGNESSYYSGAFNHPLFNADDTGLPCPTTTDDADANDCAGYELLNDLDFDTDGDGSTWTEPSGTLTGDMNDAYDNGGMGWEPIGPATAVTAATHFNATFDGNGKLIDNLFVNRARNRSGLFAGLAGDAEVVALGLPDARVESGTGGRTGALAGENRGHVGAVWVSGSVGGASATGGLVGDLSGSGSVVASYSVAAVACAGTNSSGAGLVGDRTGAGSSIAASYSTGTVTGATCASTGGFALGSAGTVAASYWDTTLSQIADDTENPPQPPEGRTSAILRTPTSYDTVAGGEALYATWDNQDVDGDGATGDGEDADPWDFGRSNEHPILKYRGLAAAPQLDVYPDTAPAFSGTVTDMTLPGNAAVSFQVPAATGGNGAYRYAASGLPAGLSLGLPDCADERTVCGAPTAAGVSTVTVTVADSDSNMEATDRDTLTFMATVPAASASIASTTPTALTETNLNGARVAVELTGSVFHGLSPAGFALATTPPIAGLSIASATRTSPTQATLTLRFDGTDFNTQATLLVRVLAAAHRFGGDQDTGAVAVTPTGGVMLSATTLALEEDPGTTNANVGTYTAVLAGQPAGAVTVTPASSNPDVTLSGALTFNATNWNTAQTVTATAGADDDAVDDVAHVTHAVQGVPGVASGPRVRVTVNDDDSQGLTLDAATLTGSGVTEGMTATYTVRLASEPTGPVTVAIASSEDAATVDADAGTAGAQNTLLFHAMNWNTPQTATVHAAEDDDGESESVMLTHDPSGADYGEVENVDVSFAVSDNDAKGATLSTTALNVQENGSATYTLVLNTEPVGGAVSVPLGVGVAANIVTRSPSALTFTAENWDAPQTVTVTGVDDANTGNEIVALGHTPTGGGYNGVIVSNVNVTTVDDDVAGLKVSPVNLTVAEGATATYTVRLNVAPTGTTTVTVGGATAKLAADADTGTPGDQTTLSFDAANWDTAQTVTVTGAEDADGADETASLTHAVAGTGDYAALAAIRRPGVNVLVRDDETAGVVLAPSSLAIDEGGTATYDVELSAPPATGTATVTIAATGMAGLTTDASTLSFTTTTWDTAQTVTVTAVADHARLADAQGTLTHAVTGYGAVESGPDLPVRVANTTVDYDADADGLIEIGSLAQLNAMRWDLDGDGTASSGNAATYATAFPTPRGGGVCPTATSGTACRGFELTTDLDFDTDGDGRTWTETGGVVVGDDGDDYYNGGLGWEPVGDATAIPSSYYRAVFRGNGHVVGNLFVDRNRGATGYAGLFGLVVAPGRIESLGLVDGYARDRYSGLLAGFSNGAVAGCYSTGRVAATDAQFAAGGGLIGVFGSTGGSDGSIAASYSTARVTSAHDAGGLIGRAANPGTATIDGSWAAGPVSGASGVGGLVGAVVDNAAATTASYYDNVATGQTASARGTGQSTADLQSPTGYAGIYANWDVDLDGDYEADDPWHFGTSRQYPSLKWGGFDPSKQFAVAEAPEPEQEPAEASSVPTEVRTETTSQGLLVTWRAVAGATAYLVQWRQSGQAWSSQRQAETAETRYEIAGLPAGAYEVRVLAVVDGEAGEPSAPARGEAGTPNRPPLAHGIADVDMDVGRMAEVALDAAFSDPDGDVLRYAASADGGAVEAWASGGTLRLRGMHPGEATVTATATDPDGLSASASFAVRVGAVLSLRGSPAAPEGGEAVLTAELSRPLGTDVEVRWRLAADGEPGTADADAADFAAWSGTATIAAGGTLARIVLAVLDDEDIEPARERFAVELEEPADPNVGLSARAWRALGAVQEGVCDRTPEVRAELSRGWRACRWPSPADLARLSRLDLRGAGAESLRADDLLGLSGLRTLDLGRNALRELPAGLLSHSPRLRSLRLDGNRLQSLPAALFAGVSGLRELRLSGNPGAPFALAPALRRTDADPWAAGPATVEARLPLGAPFAMRLALTVAGGEASAEELALAAGAVASGAVRVSGDGPARVVLAAPTIPDARCGDGPCFDGLAAEGSALALFATPPRVAGEVAPAELLGADAARIDLSAHFAAGGGGALSYSAVVDDPRLATVSVDGAILTVAANEDGEEGTATVTVVATDETGQTAALRFQVEVSPRPPANWRGWRSTIGVPAAGQQDSGSVD